MANQVVFPSQRYGRLVVLRESGRINRARAFACLCDCGRRTETRGASLRNGQTRSCGCLRDEAAAETARTALTTHGLSKTPSWLSWQAMHQRCSNPKKMNYEYYGGRGIAPCAAMSTFDGFFAAVGERPAGQTLDRIDNDGGYWCGSCSECVANAWPKNVRWATALEQTRNRRRKTTSTSGSVK